MREISEKTGGAIALFRNSTSALFLFVDLLRVAPLRWRHLWHAPTHEAEL